jgi:hypothetical protein
LPPLSTVFQGLLKVEDAMGPASRAGAAPNPSASIANRFAMLGQEGLGAAGFTAPMKAAGSMQFPQKRRYWLMITKLIPA